MANRKAKARNAEPEQLALWKSRGGKRRGAGRKATGPRAGAAHRRRPALKDQYPVHVVLRTVREIGKLRRKAVYLAVRRATDKMADREEFRIVHLSIQGTHIHLIVEAKDQYVLASMMQSFQISAAKYINAVIRDATGVRRRGTVFPDRYFATIITNPRQMRHTMAYVLGNWRKHREDQTEATRGWKIDWFSTAPSFADWAERGEDPDLCKAPPTYLPLIVSPARTWLLNAGWKLEGAISCYEVPSKRR